MAYLTVGHENETHTARAGADPRRRRRREKCRDGLRPKAREAIAELHHSNLLSSGGFCSNSRSVFASELFKIRIHETIDSGSVGNRY